MPNIVNKPPHLEISEISLVLGRRDKRLIFNVMSMDAMDKKGKY